MDHKYTILCVDDEENILSAIKRVLRGENYIILTATNNIDGLKLLEENEVHLVISDQRMPGMSGTEFLAAIRDQFPDVIRIILSGYTDVDAITESINKGHIYKFLLKPWNDHTIKLEIRQALEYYELKLANKLLHKKILEKNKKLNNINEKLKKMVKMRTKELEIQNQVLELSRAILENLPVPIIGISSEKIIVYLNHRAESLLFAGMNIAIGYEFSDYFKSSLTKIVDESIRNKEAKHVKDYLIGEDTYDLDFTPLYGDFSGRGVILSLKIKDC